VGKASADIDAVGAVLPLGMSQGELAKRTGRRAKTINEIVHGKHEGLVPFENLDGCRPLSS